MYRIRAIGPLPKGYVNADYFLENVLSREFVSRTEAEEAARATYTGPDRFGDEPKWDVVEIR
jgi:hypothetical protein